MKLKGTILEIKHNGGVFKAILKVAFIPESELEIEQMELADAGDEIELPEFEVNPSEGTDGVPSWAN